MKTQLAWPTKPVMMTAQDWRERMKVNPLIMYDEEESVIICEYCNHFAFTTPGKIRVCEGLQNV